MGVERRSLCDAVRDLREGRSTASDLAEAAIERHDPALNAYAAWTPERLRDQAQAADAAFGAGADLGLLQGIPVSIKDIYAAAGWPTHAGSPNRLPADPWERDGPLMQRLRRQLAAIPGKTNTVEFAFGGIGTNAHWGTPRNPWDRSRVPGGSSSGAAVSLAEGTAMLALGTDTAGSVRIPAAMTGYVGLKTGAGRWPTEGIVPLSRTLDTAGILARSAADLAFGFAALEGRPDIGELALASDGLSGRRFALPRGVLWADCSPGIVEAVEAAIGELEAAGASIQWIDLPEVDRALELFRTANLAGPELYALLSQQLPDWLETLDPGVRARVDKAAEVPAWRWLDARRRMTELSQAAHARLAAYDALLSPTVAITPPAIEAMADPQVYGPTNLHALRNTAVGNYLTLAGVTLPVGLDAAGMPVGLQMLSVPGSEEWLIALAIAVEKVLGSADDRLGLPRES
jgi:aspartyl-tRNA(Asn)/glutamyl-tRNA(Gln) amidotransferase subunit A